MTVLLLDSASLYYRAFHALPDSMTDDEGHPVNAVRGFLDTVAALVRERRPEGIVACWDDDWRPAWRVELVPAYKTHRVADAQAGTEDTPDTLGPQVDVIVELLGRVGIPVVGHADWEADDVIATLAGRFIATDIASGDRDLVQLVSPTTTLLYTGGSSASRGGRPWLELDSPAVAERFGVPPDRYADVAILRGDPSDGLPGVRGVGEKTATALVQAFGSVESILAVAHSPAPPRPMTPRIQAALLAAEDDVARSAQVVRLVPRDGLGEVDPVPAPRADAQAVSEARGAGAAMARLLATL